jgi:hypothetical protein
VISSFRPLLLCSYSSALSIFRKYVISKFSPQSICSQSHDIFLSVVGMWGCYFWSGAYVHNFVVFIRLQRVCNLLVYIPNYLLRNSPISTAIRKYVIPYFRAYTVCSRSRGVCLLSEGTQSLHLRAKSSAQDLIASCTFLEST